MSDLFQQQSPLVQIKLGEAKGEAPTIREVPFLGFLNLRGKSNNTGIQAACLKVLSCELPVEANTMIESGDNRIYWLGPDEWLIVTPTGQQAKLADDLRAALQGVFSLVLRAEIGSQTWFGTPVFLLIGNICHAKRLHHMIRQVALPCQLLVQS